MGLKVGINGAGRIGRALVRILREDPAVELCSINDVAGADLAASLLCPDWQIAVTDRLHHRQVIFAGHVVEHVLDDEQELEVEDDAERDADDRLDLPLERRQRATERPRPGRDARGEAGLADRK